ncbi:Zinc dependent phospholipase C [Aquisphaera giovannonii]|uniref:Zinc dependent phospholipase C n=1 Tax=Aquisphaera giovannonii TaxID=406548 RepID=A0A5B9W870_9BACT|nr:hypothetical protein [Aquisphaera giovannonii]QEH36557.1 Zinc dependent phospholipase C [Aquisphaera giovannonii]
MNSSRFRYLTATAAALAVVLLTSLTSQVAAWDSRKFAHQPVHPTHSYFTEWAIDSLKADFPEVEQFRRDLVDGANEELHELKVTGTSHGIDLDAARIKHKGTNEGCDDIQGWWDDAAAAYKAGDKAKAYYLLGIMLHMVQDMGVPAHANKVYHQGNLKEFDNFEFLGVSNWKPKFDDINRTDPANAEPWKYYALSQDWTHADAPNYNDRDSFSKTWLLASADEKKLFSNREGRTCHVTMWAMKAAAKAFKSL